MFHQLLQLFIFEALFVLLCYKSCFCISFYYYVDAGSGLTLTGYYAIKISFLGNVELISIYLGPTAFSGKTLVASVVE